MLAIMSSLNVLYRICTLVCPPFRRLLLRTHVRRERSRCAEEISLGYGDWFILHKLGENMNPIVFAELLTEIHDRACVENKRRKGEELFNQGLSTPLKKTTSLNKV
jgi:hypothetical protein